MLLSIYLIIHLYEEMLKEYSSSMKVLVVVSCLDTFVLNVFS